MIDLHPESESGQAARDKANRWMIDRLLPLLNDLPEWEQGFVRSVRDRLHSGLSLTPKQEEVLTRIFEKW